MKPSAAWRWTNIGIGASLAGITLYILDIALGGFWLMAAQPFLWMMFYARGRQAQTEALLHDLIEAEKAKRAAK